MPPQRRKPTPKALPATPKITSIIPLPYRLFHLYIEPLLLVPGGIFLCLFHPSKFLSSTTPAPALQPFIPEDLLTPPAIQLMTNTAGLYIVFMLSELLVLRLAPDLRIWRVVIGAILACDVLHLWGVWVAGGGWEWVVAPGRWRMEDWINQVILLVGVLLRVGFLTGVGFGGVNGREEGGKLKDGIGGDGDKRRGR